MALSRALLPYFGKHRQSISTPGTSSFSFSPTLGTGGIQSLSPSGTPWTANPRPPSLGAPPSNPPIDTGTISRGRKQHTTRQAWYGKRWQCSDRKSNGFTHENRPPLVKGLGDYRPEARAERCSTCDYCSCEVGLFSGSMKGSCYGAATSSGSMHVLLGAPRSKSRACIIFAQQQSVQFTKEMWDKHASGRNTLETWRRADGTTDPRRLVSSL